MALFHPDDPFYDDSVRQHGFDRYKQLMSWHAFDWLRINLFTTVGFIPYILGITWSILASSILILIPCSFIGGAIAGPFLAGMIDSIHRGLRDDYLGWWSGYRKSWRQNFLPSLLPGGLFGLIIGTLFFMIYMLWNANRFPGWGTLALFAFSMLIIMIIHTLYWPLMVLFDQPLLVRARNILLFTSKYLWKMVLVTLLQLIWLAILVLFAPLTLIVVPFLGFWYILFVTQLIFYEDLNFEFHIEELFYPERMQEEEEEEEE